MQANHPDEYAERSNESILGTDESSLPKIPEELAYLVEPAMRFNEYQFEEKIQEFLEQGSEADFGMLASLAERAKLGGHYAQVMLWMDSVSEQIESIVDKRHPYFPTITRQQERDYLAYTNPELSEKGKRRAVRLDAELDDPSQVARERRELRMRLQSEADRKVHDFEVYALFGLMGACGMEFE